jgi:hypothetical protein
MRYCHLHFKRYAGHPTILRDIDFIRNQNSSAAKRKDLACRICSEQQNTVDSIGELMKNLCLLIDNPKIEVKERMKAMNLIIHCYYMRSKLLNSEGFNKEFLDYTEKVKRDEDTNTLREQEISRREKSLERTLEDHLKSKKITQEEIWEIRDPNAVF